MATRAVESRERCSRTRSERAVTCRSVPRPVFRTASKSFSRRPIQFKVSRRTFFRSGNAAASHRAPGLAEMTATVVRTGTSKCAAVKSRKICGASARIFLPARARIPARFPLPDFPNLRAASEIGNELAREAAFPEGEFDRNGDRSRKK